MILIHLFLMNHLCLVIRLPFVHLQNQGFETQQRRHMFEYLTKIAQQVMACYTTTSSLIIQRVSNALSCSAGMILCRLHGLKDIESLSTRARRSKLLHHIFNGDYFSSHCSNSSPLPDRSACLCIARGFSSAIAISEFLFSLVNSAAPSELCTEDLLFVVESLGIENPYANRLNLRQRTTKSLATFLTFIRLRRRREECRAEVDPYGDIYMAFEQKKLPALQAIMDHHGLSVAEDEKLITKERMRRSIIDHISQGDCVRSIAASRTIQSRRLQQCVVNNQGGEAATCEDFAHELSVSSDTDEARDKLLSIALKKIHSRKTMQRFLDSLYHSSLPLCTIVLLLSVP